MQKVKAKMKCSIIYCISLGSILHVKINDCRKKRIHFVFLFLFEKLQPDTLDILTSRKNAQSKNKREYLLD